MAEARMGRESEEKIRTQMAEKVIDLLSSTLHMPKGRLEIGPFGSSISVNHSLAERAWTIANINVRYPNLDSIRLYVSFDWDEMQKIGMISSTPGLLRFGERKAFKATLQQIVNQTVQSGAKAFPNIEIRVQ